MVSKTIFYGVNGEGLGHVSRALFVIEHLPATTQVHVFTYGRAYEYLTRQQYPYLYKIEGMLFSFKHGKVDYLRSTRDLIWFMMTNKNQGPIIELAQELKPSLFISDFEPSIPRVAHALRKPLLSVDNQHRFVYRDMTDLPFSLRAYGWGCGLFAKWIVPKPDQAIVSTFHYDQLGPSTKTRIFANGLMKKSLEEIDPKKGDFVLVYCRESISDELIKVLEKTRGIRYKIYGVPQGRFEKPATGEFEFCELGPNFVEDLANCRCLVGSAGNQLISEARFLGKPILAIPEPLQFEQSVNAFYVTKLRLGLGIALHQLTPQVVEEFVCNSDGTNDRVPNGVHTVVEVIEQYLKD